MDSIVIAGDALKWVFAVITAIIGLLAFIVKVVHWVDNQKLQDKKIKTLEEKHDADIQEINKDLKVLNYALLASLKASQGDSSNVPDAIAKIEERMSEKAYD